MGGITLGGGSGSFSAEDQERLNLMQERKMAERAAAEKEDERRTYRPSRTEGDSDIEAIKKYAYMEPGDDTVRFKRSGGYGISRVADRLKARGIDVDNVVVERTTLDWIKNKVEFFTKLSFGWVKCMVTYDDVPSFAGERLLAKLSSRTSLANDAKDSLLCYFEAENDALQTEEGVKHTKYHGSSGRTPKSVVLLLKNPCNISLCRIA